MTMQPEHVVTAYHRERPSITRLILEARWAFFQLVFALEHDPDGESVPTMRRQNLLHLGALTDILALRSQDPTLHESARDQGDFLREVDGLTRDDHPLNAHDHLRTQYGLFHGHDHGAVYGTQPPASDRPHRQLPIYPDGPRLLHQMCDTYAWATLGRCLYFPPVNVADETRRHLITRGLILDWAAAAAPADTATAAAAATAGHALRTLDGRPTLNDDLARAYLLDSYRDLYNQDEDDEESPHPAGCAGGCDGTGEVLAVLTWESHGDGLYVPVHQEPIDCFGTSSVGHAPDCATCDGHGYTHTPGYRGLCLEGRIPEENGPKVAVLPPQG
ncbi:hypothetical protein ACIBEA_38675 [Streptomyces sp. NPDC051555]|uniref:hypothetical protein n=1 Tax=Streptomyces sp. NPDC051555 TaxID=3365657 RepID=UPI0037B451E2